MAPAASTTDVWYSRAAHSALAVRHVQFTPAADAREPGRSDRTAATRARPPTRGAVELIIPHVAAVRREGAHCAGARTRVRYTHTRHTHTQRRCNPVEMHMRSHKGTRARTRARARTHARVSTNERARTHAHSPHTQTHTHTKRCTRTRSLHAHARAHTPNDPSRTYSRVP